MSRRSKSKAELEKDEFQISGGPGFDKDGNCEKDGQPPLNEALDYCQLCSVCIGEGFESPRLKEPYGDWYVCQSCYNYLKKNKRYITRAGLGKEGVCLPLPREYLEKLNEDKQT